MGPNDAEATTPVDLQDLIQQVRALGKQPRAPSPAATGIEGAARYVGFSVRKFKSMEAVGLMPAGRATSSRSFVWLYRELDAALAVLPKKTPGMGEPARLAAGKAAAQGRKRGDTFSAPRQTTSVTADHDVGGQRLRRPDDVAGAHPAAPLARGASA